MVVGTAVGIAVLQSLGGNDTTVDSEITEQVRNADYPICGGYEREQRIDARDFKTLLYARHLMKCEQQVNVVRLDFPLTHRRLEQTARTFKISDSDGDLLLLYDSACDAPPGFNGIVVGTSPSTVLFPKTTKIRIEQATTAVKLCPA